LAEDSFAKIGSMFTKTQGGKESEPVRMALENKYLCWIKLPFLHVENVFNVSNEEKEQSHLEI